MATTPSTRYKGADISLPKIDTNGDTPRKQIYNLLARNLAETNRILTPTDTDEILFCEGDNVWKPKGDRFVRKYVVDALPLDATPNAIRHVKEVVKALTYIEREELGAPPGKIPVKNGLLDVTTSELEELRPTHNILHRHPVEYDPAAEAPEFLDFVEWAIPDKTQRQKIQEFAGYTLLHWGQPYQRMFILVGPPRAGKSTFLNILEAIHDPDSVNNASLKKLADSRFEAASLFGKLVNIRADLPPSTLKNIGLIKELVGEDSINVERKGQDPFQFRNTAKMIFSCNQTPVISNRDEATLRRLEVEEFPNSLDKKDVDEQLKDRIKRHELNGVFLWMFKGLQRLLEQRKFTASQNNRDTEEMLLKWGDPILRFVHYRCERKPTAKVPVNDLTDDETGEQRHGIYPTYVDYCAEIGSVAKSKQAFTKALQKIGIEKSKRRILGKSVQCYLGIDLDEEANRIELSEEAQEALDSVEDEVFEEEEWDFR